MGQVAKNPHFCSQTGGGFQLTVQAACPYTNTYLPDLAIANGISETQITATKKLCVGGGGRGEGGGHLACLPGSHKTLDLQNV